MRVFFDYYIGLVKQRRLMGAFKERRAAVIESPTVAALKGVVSGGAADVERVAQRLRQRFKKMVLVGIGGSALSARLLSEAFGQHRRLSVLDNVDPEWVAAQLKRLGRSFCLCVVTKSGTTAETAALTSILLPRLRKLHGRDHRKAVVVITDPEKGPLRAWAQKERITCLAIPPDVPGRFSVFTPVGLLPAAFCGVDVSALLKGAKRLFEKLNSCAEDDPAWVAALGDYAHWRKRRICVLFVYSGMLARLRDWFVQLWAESLGKRRRLDGSVSPTGQTPLGALGVTDQHSLLQLFAEGPDDKTYTLVVRENAAGAIKVPKDAGGPKQWGYLEGKRLNDLFYAEAFGTEATLIKEKRPLLKVVLEGGMEEELGALLAFFMMRTAYVASLIEVDAFNQPGVEYGKRLARAMLVSEELEAGVRWRRQIRV